MATPTCDVIPFLAQGASATVGGVTVSVPANTATSYAPNYYFHSAQNNTGGGRLYTTWTFTAPVTELQVEFAFHADATGEVYQFTGTAADGTTVLTYRQQDSNATQIWKFSAPLQTLTADYTPITGQYGSVIRLSLPSASNGCGTATDAPLPTCSQVPFLAPAGTAVVEGTTVTATANTATSYAPNYYFHSAQNNTGGGRLYTTWTFAAPVSEIKVEFAYHADSTGGEVYQLTGVATDGSTVLSYRQRDSNATQIWKFSAPVQTLTADYTPITGPYGSLIRLSLPSESGACGTALAAPKPATVAAPSGNMTYGAAPPTLNAATAFETATPSASVTFDSGQLPTCVVMDTDGVTPLILTTTTPVNSYAVTCSGGTASGYDLLTYLPGSFVVSKGSPVITYTGTSGVAVAGSSLILSATTSLSSCTGAVTYTIIPPTGTPFVGSPSTSTSGWSGVYLVTASYPGDANCNAASDSASVIFGSAGDTTTGGGWYNVTGAISGSSRVNFGETVQKSVQTDKKAGTTTTTMRGQVLWINSQEWRLKGSAYSQTIKSTAGIVGDTPAFVTFGCPAGVGAVGSSPRCGAITGIGVLQRYDDTSGSWITATEFGAGGRVGFVATIYDGGQIRVCKGKTCSLTDLADSFGLAISGVSTTQHVPVGAPIELNNGKNGQVVIRTA